MPDEEKLDVENQDEEKAELGSDALDEESYEGEEWLGEEEWTEEDDDLIEEAPPSFVDNGDGTVSDTRNSLMWKKSDSFEEFGYGITWYEANDYCELMNEKKIRWIR